MPIPEVLPQGNIGYLLHVIYGCDLGTRRIALMCPETGYAAAMRMRPRKEKTAPDFAAWDASVLAAFVREHVPREAILFVEKAIAGASGNRQTAIHMGIANGAVIGAHIGESHLVLPMVWKKAVVGHGHADKNRIREWLELTHPETSAACQDDQDLRDAACVALYGRIAAEAILEGPGLVPAGRP